VDYYQALDSELLASCKHDDIKAFNELFRRYATPLYKQGNRYLVNPEVAEELMLDIMLSLWEKRHVRDISGELSAYLYRCMRNKIVDQRRKMVPKTIPIEEGLLLDTLTESSKGDDRIMCDDAEKVYIQALEKMSPQRRKVFQMSREQAFTYKEIAQEMNLSVNTVENYMASALIIFRAQTNAYITLGMLFMLVSVLYI